MNRATLMKVVSGLLVACITIAAPAEQTYWQHAPATPGDWWNLANWTAGLPAHEVGDSAYVDNGGTASIASGAAEAGWLYLGAGNDGTVTQSGGTHSVGYFLILGQYADSTGQYDLSGGELSALAQVIGDAGTGQFLQTSGVNTAALSLAVGLQEGSNGVYELSGAGQVFAHTVSVGREGTGRFTQTGGSHTVGDSMIVGAHIGSSGLYQLRGGQLSAATIQIASRGEDGAFEHSGGTNAVRSNLSIGVMGQSHGRYELSGSGQLSARNEYFGVDGGGAMLQTGGTNMVSGELVVAQLRSSQGAYEFAGGEIVAENMSVGELGTAYFYQHGGTNTVRSALYLGKLSDSYSCGKGTYELAGGSLSARAVYIGYDGNGHFLQNGGTVTIEEDLHIAYHDDYAYGRYTLAAGQLTADSETIGTRRSGSFVQTGGSNVVLSSLTVEANGEYAISGGSLIASELHTGSSSQAKFSILDAGAAITVLDALRIGHNNTFAAVPGSEIHMQGASFFIINPNQNPDRLMGLRELNLIFEGGLVLSTFEVAGLDVGADAAGFDEQFALGTLTLGGVDVGWVQLVDDVDNHTSTPGVEALYVSNLVVGPGSVLDLNGRNLYYHSALIDPGATIVLNGGQMFQTPEPAAVSLLTLGAVVMLFRRRSARLRARGTSPSHGE